MLQVDNLVVLGFRREAEMWRILDGKIDDEEHALIQRVVSKICSGTPADDEAFRAALTIIRRVAASTWPT